MNIDELFTKTDDDDNKIICHRGKVELRLKGENGKARNIGNIYVGKKSGKLIYNKIVKPENLYRKFNAWGINYEIYKNVDAIIIHVSNSEKAYQIKTADVNIDYLHFKKIGFELQVFIRLNEWKEATFNNN